MSKRVAGLAFDKNYGEVMIGYSPEWRNFGTLYRNFNKAGEIVFHYIRFDTLFTGRFLAKTDEDTEYIEGDLFCRVKKEDKIKEFYCGYINSTQNPDGKSCFYTGEIFALPRDNNILRVKELK